MKLNEVDKKVLCGITKYPHLSLKELSNFLDLNYWTLYKSIEKMKRIGIFKEVMIPDFPSLGFELLVVGYGSLNKRKLNTLQKIKHMKEYPSFASGIFYSFAESYRGFVLAISKNFTEISKDLIYAERLIKVREFLKSDTTQMAIFPFEITEIPMFFDYANLLCKDFKVHLNDVKTENKKKSKLKKNELEVLIELVKNPSDPISKIARNIGISPQSVSRIKDKLLKEGWIYKKIIPDLSKMGYDVLVFAHWSSNPEIMEDLKNINIEEFGYDLSNIIFSAYNSLEGIAIAPFKTLKESREIVSFFEKFGESTGVLTKEPNILFLSLQEGIKIRDHSYSTIIESLVKEF